jgi:hypothetical protein
VLLQYVKPKHQRIPSLAAQLKQDGKAEFTSDGKLKRPVGYHKWILVRR